MKTIRLRRLPLAGLLVLASLVVIVARPAGTQAVSACRSDPVVTLSNGDVVTLAADIYTASSDVKAVTYTLHGPAGTSLVNVVYTLDSVGQKENFKYSADLKTGRHYQSDTVVNTYSSPVSVVATTSTTSGYTGTASGLNKQDLSVGL